MEQKNRLLREQISTIQSRYEEKIAELSMLREIGSAILHFQSFDRLCRLVMQVIINNTLAQNSSIMLLDREKKQLFLACATNPERKDYIIDLNKLFSRKDIEYGLSLDDSAAGKALSTKKPVLIHDARESTLLSRDQHYHVEIGSLLCIPLLIGDEPLGVINLSHKKGHIFEPDDVNLFNVISNFVAIAVETSLYYLRLQNSEAKYRTLVENSNDGIAIIHQDKHAYCNTSYEYLAGYSLEELRDIPFTSLLEGTCAELKTALLHPTSSHFTFEAGFIGKEGRRLDTEIQASPITHEGQAAALVTVHDLTERKALERSLVHAQRMEAIGTLAGGVAHDLNNILSGLVSYPELILMEVADESPLKKPILTMKKSGEKAAAIVQDLLTLARRESASMEVVDLNRIVSEYIKSPEYKKLTSHHPKIQVEHDFDPELSAIKGSAVHLFKTVMNLISNAAEAMPNGGKITIATRNQSLTEPVHGYEKIREGDYVRLTVRDEGIGISSKDKEKIFEPFYTKKKMGRSGTGLGMTVVWGTVKDHYGYIDILSGPGQGTTFHLYFPATVDTMAKNKASESLSGMRGRGETILVVDDSEEQRDITSRILNKFGYHVFTAASGEEAVQFVEKTPVNLVILDMIMEPGIDGLETYKQILERYPRQKAVIISGFSETDRVKEAQKLGAAKYLKKPYTLEKLGRAVKEELGK
ncbi:MAG: response regulator [Thermodesulfobacteriota bacterium]